MSIAEHIAPPWIEHLEKLIASGVDPARLMVQHLAPFPTRTRFLTLQRGDTR